MMQYHKFMFIYIINIEHPKKWILLSWVHFLHLNKLISKKKIQKFSPLFMIFQMNFSMNSIRTSSLIFNPSMNLDQCLKNNLKAIQKTHNLNLKNYSRQSMKKKNPNLIFPQEKYNLSPTVNQISSTHYSQKTKHKNNLNFLKIKLQSFTLVNPSLKRSSTPKKQQ